MNILIVEDDRRVAHFIHNILKNIPQLNLVEIAHTFEDGFQKVTCDIFDLALVDIDLGQKNLNGIDLCTTIRKNNEYMPLIMVTGFHDIDHLESAFAAGANDYISKPFHPKELILRVQRWFSLYCQGERKNALQYQELFYDQERNEFYYQNHKLHLTKKQKILLILFIKNPERLLSRQYIREKIWGDYPHIGKNRNLRSNIQILRNALEDFCADWIHTVRGEGYLLQKGSFSA